MKTPIPLIVSIGDKYRPAMEITDQNAADAYFAKCVEHNMRCQESEGSKPSRIRAEEVERQSLGYYAGYYSHETRERVERLFRCTHPVFGKASEHVPTFKECFEAGKQLSAIKGNYILA